MDRPEELAGLRLSENRIDVDADARSRRLKFQWMLSGMPRNQSDVDGGKVIGGKSVLWSGMSNTQSMTRAGPFSPTGGLRPPN